MPPSAPSRLLLLVTVLCCPLAATGARAAQPPVPSPSLRWQRISEAGPEDAPTALASDGGARLVVGGARGVREVSTEGVPVVLLRRGPVLDMVFLEDGALLVATVQGLYRVERGAEAQGEPLSTDAVSRAVSRLGAARGLAVAATEQGVFLRGRDAVWERARLLPAGPASVAALRPRGRDLELWSAIEGELWIAGLRPGAPPTWLFAQRVALPVARGAEGAVDLAFDLPGADAVLCFPSALAVRDAAGSWHSLRPSLPPGAQMHRIAQAFGRLWLATDAGLLSASRLEGPWERAASPVGSLPAIGLVGGATLAVATHRGVLVGAPAPPLESPAAVPIPMAQVMAQGEGLSVGALHAAALRRQGLEAQRIQDLRRRVARRGWLPELRVSLGYADQWDRGRDDDQSFISGDTRYLRDTSDDRGRDLDVALTLTWDLGDTVFHPDEIDVSREARSVIALRDDVLDEVTQLYFERLRVLAQLAAVPADSAEAQALAIRAAELAAGLDAWTGGDFSRAAE